jgi:ABC-type lipoprotein export system ATPase subunit
MSLTVANLRKSYSAPDGTRLEVLNVPYFALADGEQVALVGSSGSGKTTLLHAIAGIIAPDSGRVLLRTVEDGEFDMCTLPEHDRDVRRGRYIGYVFQTHHLLPGFTALENVLLGMSFTGRGTDKDWARHLLGEVGLSERLNYVPGKLSIGQQQRVAVARAMASRPRLVLADEPTGALDEDNAQLTLDLIRKLCTEVSAALVVVTHDLGIANQLPRKVQLAEINLAASQRKQRTGVGGVAV